MVTKKMEIRTALGLELGHLNQPVVTSYQVGLVIYRLYKYKSYQGKKLTRLQKEYPERSDYTRLVKDLTSSGILQSSKNLSNKNIYTVLGQDTSSSEELACCIDPFCYISHMSAMEYHGLTDRLPKTLFLTAPEAKIWTQLATERMNKDLGNDLSKYIEAGMPLLNRTKLKKINRKIVDYHTSKAWNPGCYLVFQDENLRVSTIGRTFLDMIREPDLCGGIYHVLDIFEEYAPRYLKLIVAEVEQHGTKIDKVRVGYILDEKLKLYCEPIKNWLVYVQRGGSRKLYAHHEYSPVYSEKWCLSINIETEE